MTDEDGSYHICHLVMSANRVVRLYVGVTITISCSSFEDLRIPEIATPGLKDVLWFWERSENYLCTIFKTERAAIVKNIEAVNFKARRFP